MAHLSGLGQDFVQAVRKYLANVARSQISGEANDRFFAEMMHKRHRQIFWQHSCRLANSYYFDKHGDVALRPASTLEVYWRSRRFPLDDYRFTTRAHAGADV
jgi:hypothetical protein